MKRVQIGAANIVTNVSALAAGSPAGIGTFLDVADTMAVSPNGTWNGNVTTPAFSPAPALPFSNPLGVQTAAVKTAAGVARVTWLTPFSDVPVPIGCEVFDPAGGRYDVTLIENTALTMAFAISIQRPLPTVITLVGSLAGYDTYNAAPDGLTVYLSAKIATQ